MFLKLLPGQVMQYWDEISACIEVSLPPHVEPNFLHMQELFLTGDLEAWASVYHGTICAVMTTQWIRDATTDTIQLLIFTLNAVDDTYPGVYKEMHDTILEYARSRSCKRIIAYTHNEKYKLLAERFGADTSWYLLSLEVK